MSRLDDPDDADDASLDDRELPDASDMDDDDEDDTPTEPCRYCRRTVYDGAEVCPACGNYLSREDAPARASWYPLWVIIGAIICLAIVLLIWTR